MNEHDVLAKRFEAHRSRLRAVAYQTLGSASEADDAVQETWLRLSRSDVDSIENLAGWLTTVVSRVCLNMLQARREEPVGMNLSESVVSAAAGGLGRFSTAAGGPGQFRTAAGGRDRFSTAAGGPGQFRTAAGGSGLVSAAADGDPETEALLADSIGPALLVILHTLAPAERLAFVLHDMFAVPFDDIAPIVGRSSAAARQLASRGRRRVQGVPPVLDADLTRQRAIVDAFLAAARRGDFDALLEALDPDVVVRSNGAEVLSGAAAVAGRALAGARYAQISLPALINGAVGVVIAAERMPISLMAFTITDAKIVTVDLTDNPGRITEAELVILGR
ncbi:MAG TPA: sigma-70 family RNA polymerase sigma factor [Streptosporangiaceae bacterium]